MKKIKTVTTKIAMLCLTAACILSAVSCVWHSISGTILANIFVLKDKVMKS